jgi:hypothetical protein
MPVVTGRHLVHGLDLPDPLQAFFVAKTVVCLPFLDELKGVFLVELEPLRLHVRPEVSALVSALVPFNPQPGESIIEIPHVFLAVAGLVGVFNAEDKLAAGRAGI